MPNWCTNRLIIKGTKSDILAFVNAGISTILNTKTSFEENKVTHTIGSLADLNVDTFPYFSAWYPMPSVLMDISKLRNKRFTIPLDKNETAELNELCIIARNEVGTDDWYSWATGHWGVKWDTKPYSVEVRTYGENAVVELGYETAWCPNDGWMIEVGEKYPQLSFYLDAYEPGCNVEFGAFVEDGEYCECGVNEEWLESVRWDDEDEEEVETDDSCLDV